MDEREFELQSRSADRFAAAMCMLAMLAALLILGFGFLHWLDERQRAEDRERESTSAHPTSPSS